MQLDYLTFEDRSQHLPALMLLVASLRRVSPRARLHLPARDLSAEALTWLSKQPHVVLHGDLWPEDDFWNIKPFLLAYLLREGLSRLTWLDADMILTSDPANLLAGLKSDQLLVAQEGFRSRDYGTAGRTQALGLEFGREHGYSVNSCVVSVTARHLPLLDRWTATLRSPLYRQATEASARTGYRSLLVGDQDVLGGLLGSQDFADIPVTALLSGRDIAHEMLPGDFTMGQRIATLWRGEPRFVHAQGQHYWCHAPSSAYARRQVSQLSIYRLRAKSIASELPADLAGWTGGETTFTRIMQRIFPNRPSLSGLPLGVRGSVLNLAYRLRNLFRSAPSIPSDTGIDNPMSSHTKNNSG